MICGQQTCNIRALPALVVFMPGPSCLRMSYVCGVIQQVGSGTAEDAVLIGLFLPRAIYGYYLRTEWNCGQPWSHESSPGPSPIYPGMGPRISRNTPDDFLPKHGGVKRPDILRTLDRRRKTLTRNKQAFLSCLLLEVCQIRSSRCRWG